MRLDLSIVISVCVHALLMLVLMSMDVQIRPHSALLARHTPTPERTVRLVIPPTMPAPEAPTEQVASKGNDVKGDASLAQLKEEAPKPPPKRKPRKRRPKKRRRVVKRAPVKQPAPVKPKPAPVKPKPAPVEVARKTPAPVVTSAEAKHTTPDATATASAAPLAAAAAIAAATSPGAASETTSAHKGGSGPSRLGAHDGRADIKQLRRGYRKRVFRMLNAKKVYPALARRARLQGRVVLGITIDASGNILSVKVLRSSGHELLDREATRTVRALRRLPAPPSTLGWSKKLIKVPLIYRLAR